MAQDNDHNELRRQRTFEYGELRREILQNETLSGQILSASLVLFSSMVTLALTAFVPELPSRILLLLAAQVVSAVAARLLVGRIRSTLLIASYLRTVTERDLPGVQWEGMLHHLRKREELASQQTPGRPLASALISAYLRPLPLIRVGTQEVPKGVSFVGTLLWLYALLTTMCFAIAVALLLPFRPDLREFAAGCLPLTVVPALLLSWAWGYEDQSASLSHHYAKEWCKLLKTRGGGYAPTSQVGDPQPADGA